MPYRRTAFTEARKAETRRRLVEVARRMVFETGFQGIQIAAVATAAGVAVGTVYRYFPAKADLVVEVYRLVCDREIAVMQAIAGGKQAPSVRLDALVRATAGRALQAGRSGYALVAEPVDAALDAERIVYRQALADAFRTVIEDGVASGDFTLARPDLTATGIVGAILEALVTPLSPGGTMPDADADKLLDGLAAFCRRAVGQR
ncbi:MAG: TetR/AcrR family transcriptional regulator [Alphaproteobacteria bacterium]